MSLSQSTSFGLMVEILDVFWHTYDPTTLNRQGNDVGTQYRSAIFYHDQKQKEIAEKSKRDLEKAGFYKNAIVTASQEEKDDLRRLRAVFDILL